MGKRMLTLLLLLCALGCVGCAKNQSNHKDYLRCNTTSVNRMAEIETGYFYANENFLYYIDKEGATNWVPVCNKPNCMHNDYTCNAYVRSSNVLVQKDGKIYGLGKDIKKPPHIFEISTDGSGIVKKHEIPVVIEEDCYVSGYSYAISPTQLVLDYSYMNERGITINTLGCMKDDKFHVLYTSENALGIMNANAYWNIRGDNVYMLTVPESEGMDFMTTLWRVDEDGYSLVNLPETITSSIYYGSYLLGETYTYFVPNEGFYQYNLNDKENTLICENQLTDSAACILTEEYMVEYTKYNEQVPENIYLKFYNGKKWIDVALSEDVKNFDSNLVIISAASDRIFCRQYTSNNEFQQFYYFMIEDETPELIPCGSIGEKPEGFGEQQESTESTKTEETTDVIAFDKPINVFDNAYGRFEIVGYSINEDKYVLVTSYEKSTTKKDCSIRLKTASINGIEIDPTYSFDTKTAEEIKSDSYDDIVFYQEHLIRDKIATIYEFDEYTDIELAFEMSDYDTGDIIEEKTLHCYPKGEELAIKYEREATPSDVILLDNEKVSIILTGYEKNMIENDTIQLFIKNKTNEMLYFGVDAISMNGLMSFGNIASNGVDYLKEFQIGAENCRFQKLELFNQKFFEESQITEVEKLEFLLKTSVNHNTLAEANILDKCFAVYPNGKTNEKEYVRETQDTDMMLMSNEYATIVLTGYEDYINSKIGTLTNGIVNLYLTNHTDEVLTITLGQYVINDVTLDQDRKLEITMLPQNSANLVLNDHVIKLLRTGITSVTEIELLFSLSAYGSEETLTEEAVVLTP